MKLGLISDTHDYLDPKVATLFKGVTHILHAGDVGMPALLLELEHVAPVTAVAGNTDDPAFGYRLTRLVTLAGRKFLSHHIVDPHNPSDNLKSLMAKERPDVVILHPGPMNRGIEIDAAAADGPRSVVLRQVANGVAVRMGVLSLILGA